MQIEKTTRAKTITTSIVLAVALATSGCGSDDGQQLEPATFGSETPEEREALVAIAGGEMSVVAFLMALVVNGAADESGCPAKAVSGNVITLTGGGCTSPDGVEFTGTVILENVQLDLFAEDRPDPTKASVLDFDRFQMKAPQGTTTLNGALTLSPEAVDGSSSLTDSFSFSAIGRDAETGEPIDIAFAQETTLNCAGGDANQTCTFVDSSAELSGVGRFVLEGSFGDSGGVVTLRGDNTMTIDMAEDVNGCVALQIDGTAAGTVCDE